MSLAASQNSFAENGLWHNLSCNWIWGVVLLVCCLLLSINSASSTTPQQGLPLTQRLPQPTASNVVKSRVQREMRPVPPQYQQLKVPTEKPIEKPSDKKVDLDGVT